MTSEDENNSSNSSYFLGLANTEITDNYEEEKLEKKTERCMSDASLYDKNSVPQPQKQKFKERVEKLIGKYKSAKLIRNIDKTMFFIGLCRLVFEAFLLGRAPYLFPYYFSIVLFILIFCRFVYYRWLQWHYFFFDFCYWANLLIQLFLWVFPGNRILFISSYAFSMGPLLLAVPIFKNSMVLHSLDRITSSFIHLVPGYLIWAIRSDPSKKWPNTDIHPSFLEYLIYPSVLYLLWAVIYYLILFKFTYKRCEKKKNLTLFKYHLKDKNSIFYKISGIFGEKIRPIAFMGMHMMFSFVTLIITYITLYSTHLQLGCLVICTVYSFWLGSIYYMEIFTKNYEMRLQQLENLKSSLSSKKNE